jgi:hypothetical protein
VAEGFEAMAKEAIPPKGDPHKYASADDAWLWCAVARAQWDEAERVRGGGEF